MGRRRFVQLAATAVLASIPSAAQAVAFYSNADPAANKVAPTGSLANSGWQYEFSWRGGFLGTPIAPHYFLSAKHLAPGDNDGVGNSLEYNGETYTVTAVAGTFGDDLRLYQVDNTFHSYAPMYDSHATNVGGDGDESGKSVVMIGRGGARGTEVRVGNSPSGALLGWNWSNPDAIQRWGENKVVSPAGPNNTQLAFSFSRPGAVGSDAVTDGNEAALVNGDSGGGVFIYSNNQWKLAGVNYSVSGYYHYTATTDNSAAPSLAALYDTRGLYDSNGNLITGAVDQPSYWFASRVGETSTIDAIKAIVNLPPTWNVNSSSSWTTAANWANGTPANTAGAIADFRTAITADRTVTLSSGQTVGTIDFDSLKRYTLTGSTITLDTTGSSTNAQINVASGNQTIASALTINKNLDLNVIQSTSTLTLSGQMSAATRTIRQVGVGTVEYKNVRADTLNVQQGAAKILSDGSSTGTSKVNSLVLNGGTSLDLSNNDLVATGTAIGSWGGPYSGLTGQIASGRNGGLWNGTGIRSSTAASGTPNLTGLGIGAAGDVLGFASGTKSWSGQVVTPTDTLIKYTYVGDLDLDGKITGDDYFRIDNGYVAHATGYAQGDVNFDGRIDGDDFFWMDLNYSRQGNMVLSLPFAGAALADGVSAVPEPACIGMLSVGAFLLGRRRRSRRN